MYPAALIRRFSLMFGLALVAGAVGCSADAREDLARGVEVHTHSLTQPPDCSTVDVESSFTATPSDVDGFYIVLDGTREVCATDLDGLQALASRVDSTLTTESLQVSTTGLTASNPMPGHGGDPAASNPMPGHGGDPAASNPMPGHDPGPANRALRTAAQ